MSKSLKYLNTIILLSVFPLLALLARDYIVYKGVPSQGASPRLDMSAPQRTTDIMDYAPVVEKGVFRTGASRLTPIETMGADPDSSGPITGPANVKLLGTFVGPRSFAVFMETEGGEERAFMIGEAVFGAGVLKEVLRDRAVVDRDPGEATFVMATENGVEAAPEGGEPQEPGATGMESGGAGSMRLSRQLGANEWVIDRDAVMNSLDDMTSVLTDARLTPSVAGGVIEGFVVTEIKPRGIFDAMGLKNGDVLTRINGFAIDSPEKAVQVLSGLRGETDIALDIVRGGKKNSFHYRIR